MRIIEEECYFIKLLIKIEIGVIDVSLFKESNKKIMEK